MATYGEKTEGRQPACEYMDYIVKLEKSRKITLFLNGDKNFFGAQMLVNKRHFRTWDAFLNASTEKTGVNTAVRFITTPVNGTRLDGLEDLQDRESYVAITRGQFKPIGYTTLFERHKQYLAGNVHRTSSILKIRPVEHSRIQVPGKIGQIPIHALMINVFLNGKDFDAPFRIALSQKIQRRWDLVMKEIGEHVTGILGRPKALYTVDGKKVITNASELEPGGTYVIVGSEPGGFQHYCYGCQTKAKHPKKLPPIKKKRRRPKKIVEKEIASFQPEVEAACCGDQEAQQDDNKELEFAPVATSHGDLPLDTTFQDPGDVPLNAESLPPARQSTSTPKSTSPTEKSASGKIEKVSSSTSKVAEKTQSAPFNSAEERVIYDNLEEIIGKGSVDDSQVTEKVASTTEQSYPLQVTDTEEETEQEMEEETEQEMEEETEQEMEEKTGQQLEEETEKELEEGLEKIVEVEEEKDMGGEQNDPSYEQGIASSKTAGLVSDMQQNSEKDELNLEDKKNSEQSATRQFHAEDLSAANSEIDAPPLWTREFDSDGQLNQGDGNPKQESSYVQSPKEDEKTLMEDKDEHTNEFLLDDEPLQSKTDVDVEEEAKDRSERDSTPAAMDTNDFDASERVTEQNDVQSTKGSDKILTERKSEPSRDQFLLDDRPQSKTNSNVEEETKYRSEQDPTTPATDTNNSDASEQAKQTSSDALVHKISTPLSTSEVAKDPPSEFQTTQKSSSITDIQPHR